MDPESPSSVPPASPDAPWEVLRRVPLFARLPDDDLRSLHARARPVSVAGGELLVEEGEPGDVLYVVLDGELEVFRGEPGHEVVLATCRAGDFIGEMALMQQQPRSASVRALSDSRLLAVGAGALEELFSCSATAELMVLRTMAQRVRSNESLLMAQEKMAALGTLAAGLAHELNNPAAAVQRAAAEMERRLPEWERLCERFARLGLDDEARAALERVRDASADTGAASPGGSLAASRREEEVEAWLDARDVGDAWEVAPVLAEHGWTTARLDEVEARVPADALPTVVAWLAAGGEVRTLLAQTGVAATAITRLVSAVKSYTHMDRAAVEEVDVHRGLEDTLLILHHRLKHGVEVVRDFAPDLPHVEGYPGELNQVWTNLIDNAVEAMGGEGTLTVRTRPGASGVVVEIEDDGPGIPEEVRSRVFEPFFSTKHATNSSGLGLHIARNVVVDRHHGQIGVESEPGRTCFRVRLPLRLGGG